MNHYLLNAKAALDQWFGRGRLLGEAGFLGRRMAALGFQLKRHWGAITRVGLSLLLLALRKVADIYYGLSCAYSFAVTRHEWSNTIRSVKSIFDPPSPGLRNPDAFYLCATKMQRARIKSPTLHITRGIFTAIAPPEKIIWVRPDDITCKISPSTDLSLYCNDIFPGDWDLHTMELGRIVKHRSIVQHFQDAVDWQDTDLFKDIYTRMFECGETVKGLENISALKLYYERHFDGLYEDIKEQGFRVVVDEDGRMNIPHVHIARDGRILFGNNGNHRLAIAKILGVERIPCHVRARHLVWQQLRDRVTKHGPETCWEAVDPKFATHADLDDLLGSDLGTSGVVDLYGIADQIPSMRGRRIGRLLRKLARDAPADTSVVEVGCWLGAGTAQLALGLRERGGAADVWLHCYDRWQASQVEVEKAARRGVHLSVGEDLLPRVRQTLEPFNVPIRFHKGELVESAWSGGQISIYVDDTSTAPDLFYHALQTFGSSWVPGETMIVLMDSKFWKRTPGADYTFQKHVIESNSNCFAPIESDGHAVFLYKQSVDFEQFSAESRIWFLSDQVRACEEEILHLKKSTSWRVTAPFRSFARVARGLLSSSGRHSSSV